MFDISEKTVGAYCGELGATLGEALLTPTKIYVRPLLALLEAVPVHGVSHITGGGFYENIPRMLPDGLTAVIEKKAVPVLPIFDLIQKTGAIPERDMFNTFNMGVGLCLALPAGKADEAVRILNGAGEEAVILGEVQTGTEGVRLV